MSWTRKAYPSEYVAYQEMKRRMRLMGVPLSEKFGTFVGFMDHVGPKPHPTYTLNRENNDNPAYEPGGVNWASKPDQSNNRRNTIRLVYTGATLPQFSGQTKPLAEWARLRGFKQPVMRQRRKRGWTDNENIEGQRSKVVKSFDQMSLRALVAYRPWTEQNADSNESAYLREMKPGESRLEYRARRLADETTDKWQALLSVAGRKDLSLSFDDILSAPNPERCFSPFRSTPPEVFQICVEEWRALAARWDSARDDLERWEDACRTQRSANELPRQSSRAESEVLRHLGLFNDASSSEKRRSHLVDDDDDRD